MSGGVGIERREPLDYPILCITTALLDSAELKFLFLVSTRPQCRNVFEAKKLVQTYLRR